MKIVSFKNVMAIVMAEGRLFGAPIHYLVTNENHIYSLPVALDKETFDETILKEGMFVNGTDVSVLYLRQNGRPKCQELRIYRRLKKNINKESIEKFVLENYARFEI